MEKYIEGNKAAWEEAFENRDASWGNDITERFASNKVLERCGFIKEGTIRQSKMVSVYCDYNIYGMLREDYKSFLRSP